MDWLASILGLYGTYLLGHQNRDGWLLLTIASVLMVYLSVEAGYWGMAVGQFCYVILEVRGYIKFDNSK